jgi:hypothetical protein
MFDATQLLSQTSNSILWRAVYAEKKLSRHCLKDVSVVALIDKLSSEEISVRVTGVVILGLTRIFVRKARFLLEDCSEAAFAICSKPAAKSFKQLSSRGITLELGNRLISDEMIEDDTDGEMVPEGGVETGHEALGLDNFADMSYVEQARDDTLSATRLSADVTRIGLGEPREKRRKIAMDSELEFDSQTFRQNLRNTSDIVLRRSHTDMPAGLFSRVSIPPEIQAGVRMLGLRLRESIEGARDTTLAEQHFEPEFTSDIAATAVEEPISEDIFNIEELPGAFCFNVVVGSYTRHEKSVAFLSLLNKLCEGRIKAQQSAPFDPIHCAIH